MASLDWRVSDPRHEQLQALFDLAEVASFAQDQCSIYRAAIDALLRATAADRVGVLIFDPEGVLRFQAWSGLPDAHRAALEGYSPWQRGAADAQPVIVPDVTRAGRVAEFRELFAKEGIGALAFIPLIGRAGAIGKFTLYCKAPHEFTAEEIRVAQTIATHVAFAADRRAADVELRDREARFRAAFLQAAVGMAETSTSGQFRLVNARCCEILGYTQEELRERTFIEAAHPDDRDACAEATARLVAGAIPSFSLDVRLLRKDGAAAWAMLYVSVVRDGNRKPQYLLCAIEDITSRIRTEEALKQKRRQLALARSAARLGIWEYDLLRNTIEYSSELAGLCGLAPDEPALSPEAWIGLIHPDDREMVQRVVRRSVEGSHQWDVEFRVVWSDGSVHWLLGKGTVLPDECGQPVRAAGVHFDITERKLAEAALRESEERFRLLADTAPVMIWVAGVDRRCTFFNKTWLDFTGRTPDEERRYGWAGGIHPDERERCFALYTAAFDARERFQLECRLRRGDGEYRWMLRTGVPRFAPGGVFAGYVGSDTDITDIKSAQEQALQRQKLESLGVLTRGIAHDFNNLLGSILVDAELAEAGLADGVFAAEQIQRIKHVAVRASEIVRELMIYSGQDRADLGPVDLSLLVEEMLELLKVSVSKQAVLRMRLEPNLPAVRGNAAQLRQVVMNLIINASEAIGAREGAIEVSTSLTADGDAVQLRVADTGVGMTPEQKARVFDPFFTTKFAGRGLGMAVVHGIVRGNGGSIDVSSEPGRGTTFDVMLPRAGDAAPEEAAEAAVPLEPDAGRGSTVLLVEDEEVLRGPVSRILEKKQYRVIEAGDGTAAIELLRSAGKIDAVLLDTTIPGRPSSEVIEEARRLQPEARVILMSAYSREMAVGMLGGQSIDGFIRKPFHTRHLLELLRGG